MKKIIINEKITKIPKRAFTDCPFLTTIELPKTINSIESEAFANCYHLIEIDTPENCTIDTNAFKNCFALDVVKVLSKLFGSINVNDINIQQQIENIMNSLKNFNENLIDFSKLLTNLKQLYNLINPKIDFVQIVKRFISLIMSLSYRIKDLDLQFNSFNKEINEDDLNDISIPSSFHFIYF